MFYILTKLFIGGANMVDLYVALIINGKKTFSQVPAKLQDDVREVLLALGLNENCETV